MKSSPLWIHTSPLDGGGRGGLGDDHTGLGVQRPGASAETLPGLAETAAALGYLQVDGRLDLGLGRCEDVGLDEVLPGRGKSLRIGHGAPQKLGSSRRRSLRQRRGRRRDWEQLTPAELLPRPWVARHKSLAAGDRSCSG